MERKGRGREGKVEGRGEDGEKEGREGGRNP